MHAWSVVLTMFNCMNFHNVTDRVKLLFTDGTWRKGDRPRNKNLPCRGIADKNNFFYKHSCTNRRMHMRVLLYMGFTTSPNMFNKHKDNNTFWYPNQHSKDGKTLTIRPHLRQFPSESRFTDLPDISWKLTKLRSLLWFFFQRRQTDGKLTQKSIWNKPITESRNFSGLFISVYNADSKPDFSEQHWDIQQCQQPDFSLSILAVLCWV